MRRSIINLVSIGILLVVAGCVNRWPHFDDTLTATTPAELPPLLEEPALRILVFGDFGTAGPGQREVARAIEKTHADAPPHFVLTVGDNIYPSGVVGVNDPLWKVAFERVYVGEFWDNLVFFPTLGNHDVEGDSWAQVEYSDLNPQWNMPGTYYTFRKAIPSGDTVRFLALDTNVLEGRGKEVDLHLQWVDSVLSVSREKWILAYGHHPLVTGGWHSPSKRMRKALEPRFEGRVPLFLAGHNHTTELLQVSDGLLQAVCGGGAGGDNAYGVRGVPGTLAAFTNGGWCLLHIWSDTLAIEQFNRVGTLMFRYLIRRPKALGD